MVAPLGQALQDARQAASLSVDDVAHQLNLGAQTVRDIENDLDKIIENKKYPTIYLRGYLVNYAKLVALDNIGQFIEYQQLSVSQRKQKNLRSPTIIRPVAKYGKWLWLLFILIVIAGISFAVAQQASLFKTEIFNPSVTEIKPGTAAAPLSAASVNSDTVTQNAEINTMDAPVGSSELAAETTIVINLASTAEITRSLAADVPLNKPQKRQDDTLIQSKKVVDDTQKAADNARLIDSQLQAPKKAPQNASLQLRFSGECWTEIFDATGKRLAFNLYKKEILTVHGRAPFKLKLGDPSVVAIQYQDKKVEREFTAGRTVIFSVPQKS